MAFVKQIKNVSGASVVWNGQGFVDGAVFEVPEEEDHHWRGADDVIAAVNAGDAEIGDGTNWLTGDDALAYLCAVLVQGNFLAIATSKTPASASDDGLKGQVCWDASYVYVCVATDTWKRAALNTW